MSILKTKEASRSEVLTSEESEIVDTLNSLSLEECLLNLKEKPKLASNTKNTPTQDQEGKEERWWLKRPDTKLKVSSSKRSEIKTSASMEITTSSMREFLEKERMCRSQKGESAGKDKDDTLNDILADLENATDEEIGSLLEEMSKRAGAYSPNLTPSKSGEISKVVTEEEKSVEELLEEAEKLVKKVGLSKSASKSDTLVPDNSGAHDDDEKESTSKLEDDIFHLLEQEVHKETEKIKNSPKIEKNYSPSPDCVLVYEDTHFLKPLKSLELQKKRFEEQKVEISSSSDLDDPIEKHSKSEDLKRKKSVDEENLRKEITDIEKDFFDNLLRKSRDKAEGKISGSSSFGQEDFSHFLKILQNKSDKQNNAEMPGSSSGRNCGLDLMDGLPNDPKNAVFPEKEITEILEKELVKVQGFSTDRINSNANGNDDKTMNKNDNKSKSRQSSIDRSEKIEKTQKNYLQQEVKKVIGASNELYTVELTPRLELFADAIPKLIAEKSSESLSKKEKEVTKEDKEVFNSNNNANSNKISSETIHSKGSNDNAVVPKKPKNSKLSVKKTTSKLGPSRSYDQLPKPMTNFRSSLDDVRNTKSAETLKKSTSSKLPATRPKICEQKHPISNVLASKVKFSIKPTSPKQFNPTSKSSTSKGKSSETIVKQFLHSGDSRKHLSKDEWEILCHEERHKNVLLKNQIEAEAKMYKQQMDSMRISFEEELFALKKQNIILKAKIDELSMSERKEKRMEVVNSQASTRVMLLEKELERQESLIRTYETENKRLMEETKKLQEELKKEQSKVKVKEPTVNANEVQKLNDVIKDLKEQILKLNYEVTDLKQKNNDIVIKNDDMTQQNGLLQDELFMFKEQLKTKDKFITDKLQSLSLEEMETRKKMDEMKAELKSKTEKLKNTVEEFDKFQQAVVPLEKELLELRVKEKALQEKLQVSKSHVEREKVLTQKLKDQVILDNKKILDLNRQVREMERIVKRKNPDSVSALILSAKTNGEKINLEKIKLLEDRIASLEGELAAKEEIGNEKLNELQKKYKDMQEKYINQISELEEKLSEALQRENKILQDSSVQTDNQCVENKCNEMKREEKHSPVDRDDRNGKRDNKPGPKSQNCKEDAHLIATIRGLKFELANKDKAFAKLNKELQELQKTNRKLVKEKEKLVNEKKNSKVFDNDRGKIPNHQNDNDQNSNVYQNGHISNSLSKLSGSSQKLYDPLQYSENGENSTVKRLNEENEFLKEEINKINKDFMSLKNKRLHDLNLLQEEHEREVASLVKEYSVKFGDSKVVKLQGQINTQMALISHLKQQIESLKDYKEQVLVLKVEREHLENKVKILNEKVRYLSTPGTEQLQLLQEKITILQQRHESREMTLQTLVRELLRNRNQCRDCKSDGRGKNRQLCYFRQELDHILGMLQEIANV
ncbi:centrosomal protein of 162 kDa [Chelonus insularis]|uniref:centrosomal protein of 162 kDa n=1 Tax=Chelonus insularis TaxID=460826 RepID=UPI00158AE3F4|nr:centrosomal protein of 162 kDa-like [Chelonus insularis]